MPSNKCVMKATARKPQDQESFCYLIEAKFYLKFKTKAGSFMGQGRALQSGQPVLGCARPSCFGWGVKTDKGARFYRIHKKNDGFMRHTDLKKYDNAKIMARESQLAFCEKNYASSLCDENMQWVGGLSPSSNITTQPLLLKCCTFDNLKNSWDRGIADVNPGQIVVGGEVMQDGRQYAFDYIANIKKYFKKNGSVAYSVTIRRFWCLPYPTKSNLYGKMIKYIYLKTLHRSGLSISPIKDFTSTIKKNLKLIAPDELVSTIFRTHRCCDAPRRTFKVP
uniref:Uncharacterized protein n=1 Tax=Wuchereria bancrofti TaxID=6293 RepID=A0A1I8EF58_WUCBA